MRAFLQSLVHRVRRQPVLLSQAAALLVSGFAAFGLEFTMEQSAWVTGVSVFIAALFGYSQVTPTISVGADEDSDGDMVAGPAAPVPEYTPVDVVPKGSQRNELGAYDSGILVTLACVVVILCGLVWLVQRL